MELTQVFTDFISLYRDRGWIGQVAGIVTIVVLVNLLTRLVLARARAAASKSRTVWDNAVLDAIGRPLRWMVWVVGIGMAVELVPVEGAPGLIEWLPVMRKVLIVALLTWFLLRLVRAVEDGLDELQPSVDHTTADAIAKLIRIVVMVTAGLVILQTVGISISGVLAFGGVGGIAVGFAARDLLANLFGGLTIYLDRPFSVGDWIRSPDRNIEGVVERIGWRSTVVRRFDKRPLYVPNNVFSTVVVENPSRMTNRRIYETIGLRYDDARMIGTITDTVRDYLNTHPAIDQEQIVLVNFNAFGASSLDFFIYCLTRTTDWAEYHAIKHEILLHIESIIARHGAEIAFPTQTLHWASEPGMPAEQLPPANEPAGPRSTA
jgi:MscS family membrane protein